MHPNVHAGAHEHDRHDVSVWHTPYYHTHAIAIYAKYHHCKWLSCNFGEEIRLV